MEATICKSFTFHAAHRLPNHAGKCRDLHGHTYRLDILLTGPVKPVRGASDDGMVRDFGDLKRAYREDLEPLLDHKFLNETLAVPVTTAENIAKWIFRTLWRRFPELEAVRVWETPTSYAEVRR